MARKKKPHTRSSASQWQASADDAIRLAALRWFALEIEALSIEVYASDKTKYEQIEAALRATVGKIKDIRKPISVPNDDDCPIGYVLCKDGLCAPMCDHVNSGFNE